MINWAQIGIAVSSIFVVIFTICSVFIQEKESKFKDAEALKLNNQIISLGEENKTLAIESEKIRQQEFEIAEKPDLRIEGCRIEKKTFHVEVKNHGRNTAENIRLTWHYAYASEIVTRQKELPSGKSSVFTSDIFPLQAWPASKEQYNALIDEVNSGKKSLIVNFSLTYDWNGKTYSAPEYGLIHGAYGSHLF